MKLTMEIPLKTAKEALNAYKALIQETEFKKRSTCKIQTKGNTLIIAIQSNELAALRATVNSYMRLLRVINDTTSILR